MVIWKIGHILTALSSSSLAYLSHQWRTLPTSTAAATLAEEFTYSLSLAHKRVALTNTKEKLHSWARKMQRIRCTKQRGENYTVMSICCCLSCCLSLLIFPFVDTFFWHVNRLSHFSNSCTHSFLCICLRHSHSHAHPPTHTRARVNERRVKKRVEMPEGESD